MPTDEDFNNLKIRVDSLENKPKSNFQLTYPLDIISKKIIKDIVNETTTESFDWTYSQNFNNLNDGDLHGQDGWIGNTGFDVTTNAAAIFEGAKGVEGINLDDEIVRTTNNYTSGTFYIAMKMATGGTRIALTLREGASTTVTTIDANGGFWRYTDGSFHNLEAFSDNTWYVLKITFSCSTDRFSLQFWTLAGGWGTEYTNLAFANAVTYVNRLALYTDATSTIYFDKIALSDPT